MICQHCKEDRLIIDFCYPVCNTHVPPKTCIDCSDSYLCPEDTFDCRVMWVTSPDAIGGLIRDD